MRFRVMGLALICLAVFSVADAQTPPVKPAPTPEEMSRLMDTMFGAMVPMMAKMSEAMIQAQLKMAVLPDTADGIATFKKNLFDALKKKGFSGDQAMQIVLATNIPSATPAMK